MSFLSEQISSIFIIYIGLLSQGAVLALMLDTFSLGAHVGDQVSVWLEILSCSPPYQIKEARSPLTPSQINAFTQQNHENAAN